ncbi:MAG: carbamoyltransferase [Tannerellaceae bacterium]|jgi:carbamoyltransferase|nr:carbamoyltransferase [Tannerellaceae bacterium]
MTGRIAILGISAYYHDSAAAILVDGEIMAAAQEERFTRKKHDSCFPAHAIRYALEEAGVSFNELSAIVFYDKPLLKFERLLETCHAFAPRGLRSFITAMPVWLKEKLFMRRLLRKEFKAFGQSKAPLLFAEHHLSHAASAFYPSPFRKAAILTVDGAGEWATATIALGEHERIQTLKEMHFPHSVGLLYSAFTYFLGFHVNGGEYKLMGLAPYGDPHAPQTAAFKEKITGELADIRPDGSLLLHMKYFGFATRLTMIQERRWKALFGFPRRQPESEIAPWHMNLALAIQQVTEEIVLRLARTARQLTGCHNLVMAGGVALNCVANGKLRDAGIFRDSWIQPAAGDAGGALGAALAAWHIYLGKERITVEGQDSMKSACLGPSFTDKEIEETLNRLQANYTYYPDFDRLATVTSDRLAGGKIIGWFQDRMEFGPRALGNRSILADPGNPGIQKTLNLKIKFREGFRPFAPAILEEDAGLYFALKGKSPYMLLTAPVKEEWRFPEDLPAEAGLYGRLYRRRSVIPAVTHIDYSARVQTVSEKDNPKFYRLLRAFKQQTGIGILVNTSFNVRGEPVVCTPEEAYRDFLFSGMDCLVLGPYLLHRDSQPPLAQDKRELLLD